MERYTHVILCRNTNACTYVFVFLHKITCKPKVTEFNRPVVYNGSKVSKTLIKHRNHFSANESEAVFAACDRN